MTHKPRPNFSRRLSEAQSLVGYEWSSLDEKAAVYARLGWADALPEPQQEMQFNEGDSRDA